MLAGLLGALKNAVRPKPNRMDAPAIDGGYGLSGFNPSSLLPSVPSTPEDVQNAAMGTADIPAGGFQFKAKPFDPDENLDAMVADSLQKKRVADARTKALEARKARETDSLTLPYIMQDHKETIAQQEALQRRIEETQAAISGAAPPQRQPGQLSLGESLGNTLGAVLSGGRSINQAYPLLRAEAERRAQLEYQNKLATFNHEQEGLTNTLKYLMGQEDAAGHRAETLDNARIGELGNIDQFNRAAEQDAANFGQDIEKLKQTQEFNAHQKELDRAAKMQTSTYQYQQKVAIELLKHAQKVDATPEDKAAAIAAIVSMDPDLLKDPQVQAIIGGQTYDDKHTQSGTALNDAKTKTEDQLRDAKEAYTKALTEYTQEKLKEYPNLLKALAGRQDFRQQMETYKAYHDQGNDLYDREAKKWENTTGKQKEALEKQLKEHSDDKAKWLQAMAFYKPKFEAGDKDAEAKLQFATGQYQAAAKKEKETQAQIDKLPPPPELPPMAPAAIPGGGLTGSLPPPGMTLPLPRDDGTPPPPSPKPAATTQTKPKGKSGAQRRKSRKTAGSGWGNPKVH